MLISCKCALLARLRGLLFGQGHRMTAILLKHDRYAVRILVSFISLAAGSGRFTKGDSTREFAGTFCGADALAVDREMLLMPYAHPRINSLSILHCRLN